MHSRRDFFCPQSWSLGNCLEDYLQGKSVHPLDKIFLKRQIIRPRGAFLRMHFHSNTHYLTEQIDCAMQSQRRKPRGVGFKNQLESLWIYKQNTAASAYCFKDIGMHISAHLKTTVLHPVCVPLLKTAGFVANITYCTTIGKFKKLLKFRRVLHFCKKQKTMLRNNLHSNGQYAQIWLEDMYIRWFARRGLFGPFFLCLQYIHSLVN